MGVALQAALENAGAMVKRLSLPGKTARYALASDELSDTLSPAPNIIVFEFGTNDTPGQSTNAGIQGLKDKADQLGAESWWIGPPAFDPDTTYIGQSKLLGPNADANAVAQQAIFGSNWIDSRPLTSSWLLPPDRTRDGPTSFVHFTRDSGTAWGNAIAAKVLNDSSGAGFWLLGAAALGLVLLKRRG